MSRKILKVAFAVLSLLIIASMVIFIEKHKVKPKERAEMQSTEQMNSSIISEDLQSNADGYPDSDEKSSRDAVSDEGIDNEKITKGKLVYYPKSYEIVTSEDELLKYKLEFFDTEGYPPLQGDYEEEWIDYEAIRNEVPELDNLWNHKSDYTDDEFQRIEDKYEDVIKNHTEIRKPLVSYLFVTLEIENITDKPLYDAISLYIIGDNYNFTDMICYFDKTESRTIDEKAKNLSWYHYAPREKMECTIAFPLSESYFPEGTELYIGEVPVFDEGFFEPKGADNVIVLRSLNEAGD